MAFIRSENAIAVTLQVISVLSLKGCVIKAIGNWVIILIGILGGIYSCLQEYYRW